MSDEDGIKRVDAVALRRFLDGEHRPIRELIRGVISRPEFTEAEWPLAGEEYRAQVWRIGRRLYALFAADPALARLVFFDLATVDERLRERHREALDRFADYTAAYLRNGQERGFLRADLDARVTARVVNGMVFEGAAQVARDPAAVALRDAWIRAVVTLMFDGLARPGPPS